MIALATARTVGSTGITVPDRWRTSSDCLQPGHAGGVASEEQRSGVVAEAEVVETGEGPLGGHDRGDGAEQGPGPCLVP